MGKRRDFIYFPTWKISFTDVNRKRIHTQLNIVTSMDVLVRYEINLIANNVISPFIK